VVRRLYRQVATTREPIETGRGLMSYLRAPNKYHPLRGERVAFMRRRVRGLERSAKKSMVRRIPQYHSDGRHRNFL
jgi:hypothetical protein